MGFFLKILPSPSLVWILVAMGFYLTNILLGLYIGFQNKTVQILKVHKYLFYTIVFCMIYFLVMNQAHHENTWIDYAVAFYIIGLVPFSKRWDILIHALIATVGLTLLPLLIVIQI
tara:strand:- start:292 stop:639 length:348 start_codon:yes stop_codon:yes gene_type:complete